MIESIKKKANKGRQEGSYKSLVNDYGRGQLIVGLPLWSATFPADLVDPISTSKDFFIRLQLALNKIKHSVLLKKWCPFDSVIIIWNPTLEAIDEWIQIANKEFYTDPANISMKRPFSFIKTHDFLKNSIYISLL